MTQWGQQETFGAELRRTAANLRVATAGRRLAGPDDFCGRTLVASLPTRGGFSGGNGFAPQLRQGRDHGELYILSALYIYLFAWRQAQVHGAGFRCPLRS